jgi:hypothetical protein
LLPSPPRSLGTGGVARPSMNSSLPASTANSVYLPRSTVPSSGHRSSSRLLLGETSRRSGPSFPFTRAGESSRRLSLRHSASHWTGAAGTSSHRHYKWSGRSDNGKPSLISPTP